MSIEKYRGNNREPIGEEYIISQVNESGQTTTHYSKDPIRGVKDEIRHTEETGRIAEELMIRKFAGKMYGDDERVKAIPEDSKMTGGYPYDAMQHIGKNEAILPGLGGQDIFDAITPEGRRTIWSEIYIQSGADNTEVTIGTLNKKSYILDPTTNMAITPAFDYIDTVKNDRIVVAIANYHGQKYELTARATVDTVTGDFDTTWAGKQNYPKTPDFLCERTLSLKHVQPTEVAVQNAPTGRLVESNVFGLEPKSQYADARGREMFNDAFMQVAAYARVDKAFRQEFRQANKPLGLPFVQSPTIGAALTIATYKNGESMIEITPKNQWKFIVSQKSTGEVVLINSRGGTLTANDDEYIQYVTMTDELLKEYFTKLYEEQTGMSTEKLQEIRTKLGKSGLQGWLAARAIRKQSQARNS